MVPALAAVVAVAFFVGFVVWAYLYARKQQAMANAAWGQIAARYDGHFDPKHGPWYRRSRRIDMVVDEAPMVVDTYAVSTGKQTTVYTRLAMSAGGSGRLKLDVFRKHALSGLSRALGFQDVETGDPVFDEEFVVKANDEALARAWLDADVRAAIAASPDYRFKLEEGRVVVTKPTVERDAAVLDRVARATATMATRGDRIRDNWAALAAERDGRAHRDETGKLRIEVESAGAPLRIETQGNEVGASTPTQTRIEASVVGGRGEAYELAAEDEQIDDELRGRLERLGGARVKSDGERVTLVLPSLETDADRLRDACELASELADRRSDRYR